MKHWLLAGLTGLLVTMPASAEELFFETFDDGMTANSFTLNTADVGGAVGTGGDNRWEINNRYTGGSGTLVCLGFPFSFTVANTPTQPAGIVGSPNSIYLHITASAAVSSGINNATYVPADGTCIFEGSHFARMSADVSTIGKTGTSLDFWWLCGGSDNASGQVYYSLDSGVSWTLVNLPLANLAQSPNWQQAVRSMPEWDNQPTLRFGFRFRNELASTAADPGFGVDDVRISANAPPEIFANGFED